MAKRSKNIKHKCIHLNDMRLEIAEAAKAKYLWHEEHVSSSPAPVRDHSSAAATLNSIAAAAPMIPWNRAAPLTAARRAPCLSRAQKEAAEKAKDAFVKLYGTSKKSILS
jgi:hypothetical protein